MVGGLAMMVGPLAGAGFFAIFGYIGPFYVFGGLYFLLIIVFGLQLRSVQLIEE